MGVSCEWGCKALIAFRIMGAYNLTIGCYTKICRVSVQMASYTMNGMIPT